MNWKTLFQDFRGQLSWGRFVSAVALVVAVVGQCKGMSLDNLKVWLEIAVGGYGASKAVEGLAYLRGMNAPAKESPEA